MNKMKDLDAVAYVRFASVNREFKDVNTFLMNCARPSKKRKNKSCNLIHSCIQ